MCLIFDQFEELYSKAELHPIFEVMQRLLLAANSCQTNFVLGFAWKSDSTFSGDHPAYHMWHNLADHRYEIQLFPFDAAEVSSTVTLFEKEYGHTLHKGLRYQITENSQGFPWLLKKLCIHLFEQLRMGVSQSEVAAKDMDIKLLFDRDLQRLSARETACLRAIAKTAPADWFETWDVYGQEVVRALQDKRLIIRSGDRLNIYWDVFREYVLTQEVPSVPLSYLPSSPSIASLLRVAELLREDQRISYADLSKATGITDKTVANVVRDLMMFGVAKAEASSAKLDQSLDTTEPKNVLRALRVALRRHALTIQLARIKTGTVIPLRTIIDTLRRINPAAQHHERTWQIYAERMSLWLEATGYLERDHDRLIRRDRGDVHWDVTSARRPRGRGMGFGRVFFADTSPEATIEVLQQLVLHHQPVRRHELEEKGYGNAITILARWGLVVRSPDTLVAARDDKFPPGMSPAEAVRKAAEEENTLVSVADFLRANPTANVRDIGHHVATSYERRWSVQSEQRIGQGLAQWARWLHPDLKYGRGASVRRAGSRVSKRVGARDTEQPFSFFRRALPRKCVAAFRWLAPRESATIEEVRAAGMRNPLSVLERIGVVEVVDNQFRLAQQSTGDNAEEAIRAAAQQTVAMEVVRAYLAANPTASGSQVGAYVAHRYNLGWESNTSTNSGTDLKIWAVWLQQPQSNGLSPAGGDYCLDAEPSLFDI